MSAEVDVNGISVRFTHDGGEVAALSDVHLHVPAGQLLVLLGPSGCGKSTLLNVIAGLLEPTEGEVVAGGQTVRGPDPSRGMVFQQDSTFPWMRVEENIAYGLRSRGVPRAEREAVTERFLDGVGLSDFRTSWPKELSGGMRKRVAVATAFAADPAVLLMDEPFGSLDFVTRTKLHTLLLELWQQTGKTMIFVTHDVDEALLLADRIVVLSSGRIVDDLTLDFERPRTDELRAEAAAIELRRHLLGRLGLAHEAGAAEARA